MVTYGPTGRPVVEAVGDGYRLAAGAIEVDCDRLAFLLGDQAALDDAALAKIDALLGK